MAKIVIINPRFEVSYWGFEHALPLFGKRANLPVACLALLAALTPAEHEIILIDENVTEIDFDRVAKADIVGVTGMIVQRHRMLEILTQLKERGAFTVVGGPWVTVKEDYFGDLADVIFVGEAEESWPRFLADWKNGKHTARYEQPEKTDMTRVPCPKYDQLQMNQYVFGSIQISRGCPFQCEFCDIIVTFGRRPRLKTSEQVIAELEAMKAQGVQMAFIVDDNLIGNKALITPVLQAVSDWQKAHGFPFIFFAEASIDLADDSDLMQLMVDANIQAVFVGIESPNAESLKETKKYQNLRAGGSMLEKLHRIQQVGMEVWTGMIVGFDNDDESIFEAQVKFIKEARIIHAMLGMLSAIPKTPLYDRLRNEQRLDPDDQSEYGTNVIPLRMTREALREGYRETSRRLNDVDAFFDRADSLYHDRTFQFNKAQQAYWRTHRWSWFKNYSMTLVQCAVLYYRLMRHVSDPDRKREYRKRLLGIWRVRHSPAALFVYLIKCATQFHYERMSEELSKADGRLINTF